MTAHADRQRDGDGHAAWTLVCGVLLLMALGCNRAFYRRQADDEVYQLVGRASEDPRWPLDQFTIEPDPQSRMFDPFCSDLPPMPPDDPTSHQLMHCVDCKPGWPCWSCYGKTSSVENPQWRSYLVRNEQGSVPLDRDAALQLALLHSRTYQTELEDLYLSALDVTFERFRLDAQFFGGNSTFFTADGPGRNGGQGSQLRTDTNLQMRKLFATGGELAVGDRLRRIDGGWATVLAIEGVVLDVPEVVYNFTVKGVHTYFVLEVGVLVHNCLPTQANAYHGPPGGYRNVPRIDDPPLITRMGVSFYKFTDYGIIGID